MSTSINLLPPEYRKKEMTPVIILLPMLSAITLVVGAGFYWGWMHFGELSSLEVENQDLSDTYESKKPLLNYLDGLRAEESDYTARSETIQQIAGSRVLWTKKVDQLCNVIADDDGGRRFLVLLESLEVRPPKRARGGRGRKKTAPPGPRVTLEGLCFSDDDPLRNYNQFHERVQQSEFFRDDFVKINKPAGKSTELDDGRLPSKAWTVMMDMEMKGLDPVGKKKKSSRAGRPASLAERGKNKNGKSGR